MEAWLRIIRAARNVNYTMDELVLLHNAIALLRKD